MFSSKTTVRRNARLGIAAAGVGLSLALMPTLAGTAQADTPPLYLYTTWDLYNYRLNGNVPFFSQNDAIQAAAEKLATEEGNCAGKICLYPNPVLPGSPSSVVWYSAKTAYRATSEETVASVVATALEQQGGPALLNSYYNWGGVGTYEVGNEVYSVLILAHYDTTP